MACTHDSTVAHGVATGGTEEARWIVRVAAALERCQHGAAGGHRPDFDVDADHRSAVALFAQGTDRECTCLRAEADMEAGSS